MPAKIKANEFVYEGKTTKGHVVKGKIRSTSIVMAKAELRNQGITPTKVRKKGKPIFGIGGNVGRSIKSVKKSRTSISI